MQRKIERENGYKSKRDTRIHTQSEKIVPKWSDAIFERRMHTLTVGESENALTQL